MLTVARILKGKKVAPGVDLTLSPGSRQVLDLLSSSGGLSDMISAGARLLECVCGPCIGMGISPATDGISLRTFNRNFEGRSGTASAGIYLCSPETAAASAVAGVMTDPRTLGPRPKLAMPSKFAPEANIIFMPSKKPESVEILRGPNIKPLPKNKPLPDVLSGEVLLKVGDNITTDHIMPAGSRILPLRSNIPAISEFVFEAVDKEFVARAKEKGGGFILGGRNYGQGSSREHAALAPAYLGVKAVITVSFARIHKANLINFGILPLTLADPADLALVKQGEQIEIKNAVNGLRKGNKLEAVLKKSKKKIELVHDLSPRQVEIILAGGLLNYTKKSAGKKK